MSDKRKPTGNRSAPASDKEGARHPSEPTQYHIDQFDLIDHADDPTQLGAVEGATETTRLASRHPDPDATQFFPDEPLDDDVTHLAPEADRDEDATQLAAHDAADVTQLASPPEPLALPDEDVTQLAAETDEEITHPGYRSGTAEADDAPTELRPQSTDADVTELGAVHRDDEPTQMGVSDGDEAPTELGHRDEITSPTHSRTENTSTVLVEHTDTELNRNRDTPQFRVLNEGKDQASLGPGTILKGRFKLENRLGEGGMGVVYQAVDLLKMEARDRNPYVAIKVLTEAFKRQSGSFIALQREASKAQRLAHPNIATVYDFDRDGNTVFMTMELLKGQPLNRFIRGLKGQGLPVAQALEIILGLASGLSYAHQKGLVHSDFKPGNAFYEAESGVVKVLDFGIARAAKHKIDDNSGEKTIFDPSTLGALTPAYATVEMFEGEEPDPRDDIYALACVSYELLTGRHPFNKLSAPKALDQHLRPAAVPGLTRRQQRTLQQALHFVREERTATIEAFIEGISPQPNRTWLYAGAGVAATLLIALAALPSLRGHYQGAEFAQLIGQVRQAQGAQLHRLLGVFDLVNEENMRYLTSSDREEVIRAHERVIEEATDFGQGRYDFQQAEHYLTRALRLFPDSASLQETRERLQERRNQLLSDLTRRYNEALEARLLVPLKGQDDITDVLDILRRIDPEHPLLGDPRLTIAYAQQAEQAIAQGNYVMADNLINVGREQSGDDPRLRELQDSSRDELESQRFSQLLVQVEMRLAGLDQSTQLANFDAQLPTLQRLATFNLSRPFTNRLFNRYANVFDAELGRLVEAGALEPAERLLATHAGALPVRTLLHWRLTLLSEQRKRELTPLNADAASAQEELDAIRELLTQDDSRREWEYALFGHYRNYLIAAGSEAAISQLQTELSGVLEQKLDLALNQNRFLEARRLLDRQLRLVPNLEGIGAKQQRVHLAEQAYQAQQREKERQARILGLQQTLLAQTQANTLREARETLATLSHELPADDPFITDTAPKAIAAAYLRLAQAANRSGNYESALGLVNAARDYDAQTEGLATLEAQVQRRLALQQMVDGVLAGTPANELQARLTQLRGEYGNELLNTLDSQLEARILALASNELRAAHRARTLAREVLPQGRRLAALDLPPLPTPSRYASVGLEALLDGRLSAAQQQLDLALANEPRHSETTQLRERLERRVGEAQRHYQAYRSALATFTFDQAEQALVKAQQVWRDNPEYQRQAERLSALQRQIEAGAKPCEERFAGYGNQSRASCFDIVGAQRQRGPSLVVVPAGGGNPTPFAVGKYEISVADYRLYCTDTKRCNTPGSDELPATGLSLAQAQAYVEWLSERSGQRYRLPTPREWRHAASAGGNEGNSDYNCNFRIGGQQVKGQSLLPVTSGKANSWGLVNYVGNAAELAVQDNSPKLLGGSYLDRMSSCSVNLSINYDDSRKPVTGLRVVRNLGY